MKNKKSYEPRDKMVALIRDNYNVLQSLGSFGISLGFGDKSVEEVCDEHQVDTRTFLAVVNYTANGEIQDEEALEPMLSRNIIKLQITDNHILSKAQSKSKSF